MIESTFLPYLTTIFPIVCAITLLVLRAGASRVFFDIVGTFQADRLIQDAKASKAVFEALYLDTFTGIQEAGQEVGDMFTDMLDVVIPITEEIEEARIQLEKFLDAPASQMGELADDIQDIGLEFGFAADAAMEAGAKMAQLSGVLGTASLPIGTEVGMMFGLISGMETDVAMQRLINLQQQTKFMTENITEEMSEREKANQIRRDSIRVLDQLNTVENRSVATMEQITFVMNQFASQAELTNESIASMAALSATLIEAGEEQGKGGRALRMMYARLGADINGSRKAVEDLGIAVADNEGNMRALSDVLVDLAAAYHTMSGEEQTALAQTVAGNRHYTRLIKLLENVDRVKELEFEATIAMFPAMDEIDRRRDTELFKLQKAQSEYKNYTGLIGEELLPVLTSVTKKQTEFTKSLLSFIDTPVIGDMLKGTIGLVKTMQAFAGPAATMLLSLANINVALQTQAAISRALNGEQIARLDGDAATGKGLINEIALRKQLSRQLQVEEILKKRARRDELNAGKLINKTMVKQAEAALEKNIGKLREEKIEHDKIRVLLGIKITQFDRLNGQKERTAAETRRLKKLEGEIVTLNKQNVTSERRKLELKRAQEPLEAKIFAFKEKEARRSAYFAELEVLKIKNKSKEMLNMVAAVGSIGTLFMMLPDKMIPFIDKQEQMKYGMMLNAAAFGMQTIAMVKNSIAAAANAASTVVLTKAQIAEGIALGFTTQEIAEQSGMTLALVEAQVGATASTTALTAAQANYAASIAPTGVMARIGAFAAAIPKPVQIMLAVGAIALLAKGFSKLKKSTKDAEKSLSDFNKVSLDTEMVMEFVKDNDLDINEALKERTRIYETIKDSEDEILQSKAEGLLIEMKALENARRIKAFSDESFDMTVAKDLFALQKQEQDLLKGGRGLPTSLGDLNERIAMSLGFSGKGLGGPIEQTRKEIEKFKNEYVDLAAFIDLHKITTFEELEVTAETFGTTIRELMNKEEEAVMNLTTSYSLLSSEVEGFANTREEMFYGFDRNNLTGDLVRQVTQQGVETLITNTELIMTNNFNGITDVQNIVDTIIDELESRGIAQGSV